MMAIDKEEELVHGIERRKSYKRKLKAISYLALLAPIYASGIWAVHAEEAGKKAKNQKEQVSIDEVIVTASRRDRSVLDMPLSITALSGDMLVDNMQDDLADFIRTVPGVSFSQQSSGLNTISIRGVSGGYARAKAPVSFYIDEMPLVSDPVATPDVKSFDIERIEVLRGPQGTLYGESSLGGVIRVISKKPNLQDFEGKVQGSYQKFAHGDGGYTADGMLNIPIIQDKLAIRGSVSRRDEGGFIDNIALNKNDQNTLKYTSARVSAKLQATDKLDITATGYLVRSNYGAYPVADRNYQQSRNTVENRTDDIDELNLTVNYDLDFASLTSSTSYLKRNTARLFDLLSFNGFLPGILEGLGVVGPGFQYDKFYQTLDINDKSFAQEVRLVSPGDKPFRWIVGLYYFDTDNDVGVDFLGEPDLNFNYLRLRRKETYNQKAAFGELEYDFTPKLTAVVGARFTKEKRVTKYDQSDDWGFTMFLPATGMFRVDSDYSLLTPKVALQYKPTDKTQLYISATEGFRGPGGTTDFDNTGPSNKLDAEKLWSYEAGAKGTFFQDRLSLEAAVFYGDWKDRQEVVNPEALPPQQYAANIGSAETKGMELSATVLPVKYLTLGGQVSYLKTKVRETSAAANKGNELPNQPKWQASGYANVTVPLTDTFSGRVRFDITYRQDAWWNAANTDRGGGYTLLNAMVGIRAAKWDLDIFVKNLTDRYVAYTSGTVPVIGEPRVIGISAGYTY